MIAASYSIKGPLDNAEASVNPLSIITPGILRKLFDIFPDSQPSASEEKSNNPSISEENKDEESLDELWEKEPQKNSEQGLTN